MLSEVQLSRFWIFSTIWHTVPLKDKLCTPEASIFEKFAAVFFLFSQNLVTVESIWKYFLKKKQFNPIWIGGHLRTYTQHFSKLKKIECLNLIWFYNVRQNFKEKIFEICAILVGFTNFLKLCSNFFTPILEKDVFFSKSCKSPSFCCIKLDFRFFWERI